MSAVINMPPKVSPKIRKDRIPQSQEKSKDLKDDICQVVLYNDDISTFAHVVQSLQVVFGHVRNLAEKIAREVHEKGRAIAEVENRDEAVKHKQQLQTRGLTVEVETI